MPRPLTLLAASSLGLAVAFSVLWAASYRRSLGIGYDVPGASEWFADASAGVLLVGRDGSTDPGWDVQVGPPDRIDWGLETTGRPSALGFGCWSRGPMSKAWCPLWFPVAVLTSPLAWWWAQRRKGAGRGFEVEGSSDEIHIASRAADS